MIRRTAAVLLLATLVQASPSASAPAGALDLPTGRLGDAILALGRAAGVSVTVDDPSLWSRRVPAVRGAFPVRVALRRLLDGSGANASEVAPGVWRITARRRRPSRQSTPPPPVRIADAATAPIVVTASKRDLPLSAFAGTASVVDGRDIAFAGPGGTEALLTRLATVSSTYLGAGRNKLFIRGIADSSFTGPTQATVGQYLGDIRLTYNAPDPDLRLYDIGSVEVLEGPQGTLYGAGSMGGIIRTIPNSPNLSAIGGSMTAGTAVTAHGEPGGDVSAMANLPIVTDRAALRIVGYGITDGGYIDNALTGATNVNRTHTVGGRAALRLAAGDGWTIDLTGIVQNIDGEDSQYADRDARRLTRASPVDEGFGAEYRLAQAVVSKDWGDIRFRSSTAYIRQHLDERFDATASGEAPRSFTQTNDTELVTSEVRLWQPVAHGFGWVLGGSYIHNVTRLDRALDDDGGVVPLTGVTNRIREFTGYGEASARIRPWLTVTAGGRVSHSRLAGDARDTPPAVSILESRARAAITASRSTTNVLPSVAVLASPSDATTLYLRYQQGFRPGGLAIDRAFVRRFRSDRVGTGEAGLRMGRRGRDAIDATLSVSYSEWRDIQADFVDGSGLVTTDNIGDGRIWSIAASAGWRPAPGLRIEAGLAFNDGRVTDPSVAFAQLLERATALTGTSSVSRIPNVARVTGRLSLGFARPIRDQLEFRFEASARYVGRSRLGVGPVLGGTQGDYPESAATLRIGSTALGVTLSVTNLTDSVGNRFALGTPFAIGREQITPLRPRTVRLGIDARF